MSILEAVSLSPGTRKKVPFFQNRRNPVIYLLPGTDSSVESVPGNRFIGLYVVLLLKRKCTPPNPKNYSVYNIYIYIYTIILWAGVNPCMLGGNGTPSLGSSNHVGAWLLPLVR